MNINAIDRVGPIRPDWLYPLRTGRIYPGLSDVLGASYPAEALRAVALNRAERIAPASPVESSVLENTREQSPATHTAVLVQAQEASRAPDAGQTIDWLRNQFATQRLTSAVQAFEEEQAADKVHASAAAINLGTPGQPLLIHKYLVAFGNPPIEPLQPLVSAHAGSARVAPVANVNAIRSATDNALGAGRQGDSAAAERGNVPRRLQPGPDYA